MAANVRRRPPTVIKAGELPFTDAEIQVRPLSALQMSKIEKNHPTDDDGKRANEYAYHAAIMSEACREPGTGKAAFAEMDLFGLDSADFWDLWRRVLAASTSRKAEEDPEKNGSPSGSAGPSGSQNG